MNVEIRLAKIEELDLLYTFYREVCLSLENAEYTPLWRIDSHPCREGLENHIKRREMYVLVCRGKMLGAMAVEEHGEYSSLHLLAVRSNCRKRHLAEKMMKELFQISKERGNQKILLDVVKGNLPAERLYEKAGFQFAGEKREYIEQIGEVCFCVYEYVF